jgi:secreted trypsin-like serine protease
MGCDAPAIAALVEHGHHSNKQFNGGTWVGSHQMNRAARYRRYAAHCLQLAHDLIRPSEKARVISMAEHWRRLAEHAERTDGAPMIVGDQLSLCSDPPSSSD